jgi:hypothetical protein
MPPVRQINRLADPNCGRPASNSAGIETGLTRQNGRSRRTRRVQLGEQGVIARAASRRTPDCGPRQLRHPVSHTGAEDGGVFSPKMISNPFLGVSLHSRGNYGMRRFKLQDERFGMPPRNAYPESELPSGTRLARPPRWQLRSATDETRATTGVISRSCETLRRLVARARPFAPLCCGESISWLCASSEPVTAGWESTAFSLS